MVFESIDTNNNGHLDAEEMFHFVKTNGATNFRLEYAQQFIRAGDQDGDGKVNM